MKPGAQIRRRGQAVLWLLATVLALWLAGAAALDLNDSSLRQALQTRHGARGADALQRWQQGLAGMRGQPEAELLRNVNNFWNLHVVGSDDPTVWGQTDYWATPIESLIKGAGDCEDFVIGKYFSLLALGVPAERLRFIYVRARVGGMNSSQSIAHMVLGYYATPDAEPLVLDNLIDRIQPASQRADLTPVFSFNALGVYVTGAAPASVERIGRWGDLIGRMRAEGFRP